MWKPYDKKIEKMNKELIQALRECGTVKFGDFKLVSGEISKYYIDIKKAITKPKILKMISGHIIEYINENNIRLDYVACIELGAVPIGTAVSLEIDLPLIIIRKAEKSYGLKSKIVGDIEKKKVVLLLEDVTATGGSVISAVQAMRNEELIVENVITVVDRDEGAEEALEKEGLTLYYLLTRGQLMEN